jgi:hypothetical protein
LPLVVRAFSLCITTQEDGDGGGVIEPHRRNLLEEFRNLLLKRKKLLD